MLNTIKTQNKNISVKHKIKDCVFTNMFGDKKYLLQMYHALHPEDSGITEDDLEILTLENIFVNDLYNDLGFKVGEKLICLVEAQSTWTMNILIRVLLYYAKTLKEYIDKNSLDLYHSTKANIPKPEFYVVYTGDRKQKPATINLSTEFFSGMNIDLDITVHVLYGDSNDIIGEYVTFTRVYHNQCFLYGHTIEAVKETIKICKSENVLKEYLESREKEVIDMLVTLYDEEQIRKAHDKTVFDQGISQGMSLGLVQGIITMCKKYNDTKENAILQIMNTINCDEKTATEAVDKFW